MIIKCGDTRITSGTDIDECQLDGTLCDQICENTDGSYDCACMDGYQLTEGGSQCQGKY